MRGPSTPRGWLSWAVSVSDRYGRPHSPRYEYDGIPDYRMSNRRETAISVKILAERASRECTRNGVGYELLTRFYLGDASWYSFTGPEQAILRKVSRRFARGLREAGFLPKEVRDSPGEDNAL